MQRPKKTIPSLPIWQPAKLDHGGAAAKKASRALQRQAKKKTRGQQPHGSSAESARQSEAKKKARAETREIKRRTDQQARNQQREAERETKKKHLAWLRMRQREAAKQTRAHERKLKLREQKKANTLQRRFEQRAKKKALTRQRQSARDSKKKADRAETRAAKRRENPYAGHPGVKRDITDGMLPCLDCGPQPIGNFRIIKRKANGRTYYESRCTRCRRNRCAARNQNLSPEAYRATIAAAGGKCAICQKATAKLVLDHCHTTGKVRGVLCQPCNHALAPLEQDEAVVIRMAEYLRYWRDQPMNDQEKADGIERERRRKKPATR
jgi:hypothetical protein